MDDLRIGVIGSGGRGGLARHAHLPGEGSRVVACCNIVEAQLERLSLEFECMRQTIRLIFQRLYSDDQLQACL